MNATDAPRSSASCRTRSREQFRAAQLCHRERGPAQGLGAGSQTASDRADAGSVSGVATGAVSVKDMGEVSVWDMGAV